MWDHEMHVKNRCEYEAQKRQKDADEKKLLFAEKKNENFAAAGTRISMCSKILLASVKMCSRFATPRPI